MPKRTHHRGPPLAAGQLLAIVHGISASGRWPVIDWPRHEGWRLASFFFRFFLLMLQCSLDLIFREAQPFTLFRIYPTFDDSVLRFIDVTLVVTMKLGRFEMSIDSINQFLLLFWRDGVFA